MMLLMVFGILMRIATFYRVRQLALAFVAEDRGLERTAYRNKLYQASCERAEREVTM
jgi:hypothetical protein